MSVGHILLTDYYFLFFIFVIYDLGDLWIFFLTLAC